MKYTAADLDRMRKALDRVWWERHKTGNPDTVERTIESQLLTYMMNETTPDELEAHQREVEAEQDRLRKEHRKWLEEHPQPDKPQPIRPSPFDPPSKSSFWSRLFGAA